MPKISIFQIKIEFSDLLKGVDHVIKNPFKIVNANQNPLPYSDKQEMHIDWRPRLFNYYNYNQCTAFIYLDDANEMNGSLNIYPGTHKILKSKSKIMWKNII